MDPIFESDRYAVVCVLAWENRLFGGCSFAKRAVVVVESFFLTDTGDQASSGANCAATRKNDVANIIFFPMLLFELISDVLLDR